MNEYYKKVSELLRANGYTLRRHGKGSHEIWARNGFCVSLPVNCASRHTANQVLKDAGIKAKV
jgi:predicted RNA binding protein YcfA (HicA-like mRNA interferase family)